MKERYWHIQMFLPEGKGGKKIDSIKMLKERSPVIGTGEWDDIKCRYFKGEQNGLKIGDIVLVREGKKLLALCEVISECFSSLQLEKRYHNKLYRHVKILDWNCDSRESSLFTQGTLNILYRGSNTASYNYINDWYKKVLRRETMENFQHLLKFKKQIILQGPPGTGKTRLAKDIAKSLTEGQKTIGKPSFITSEDIKNVINIGAIIHSVTDRKKYKVIGLEKNKVILQVGEKEYSPTFSNIVSWFANKRWNISGEQKNSLDPYCAALAKYIYENIDFGELYKSEQYYKLIQFHPSYSYEDFVRGIVAKPNPKGDGVIYEAEDKTLGEFAKIALENYNLSKKDNSETLIELWVTENFEEFIAYIEQNVENEEYQISNGITIFKVEDDCFRYGKNWSFSSRINFSDFKNLITAKIQGKLDIEENDIPKEVSRHAHYRYTYYMALLRDFFSKHNYVPTKEEINEKNYVLIIDEINRANLSSVLGELIYALEYRGEKVESMYEVDSKELILPPNLYIIGTMNTADRSVGHIDYAIRRRFAFVDVLPKNLTDDLGSDFETELYNKVSKIFDHNSYLSKEFNAKDVQLGHSYFIHQYEKDENGEDIKDKPYDFKLRLNYEIKPILKEYIKDGILVDSEKNLVELVDNLDNYLSSKR